MVPGGIGNKSIVSRNLQLAAAVETVINSSPYSTQTILPRGTPLTLVSGKWVAFVSGGTTAAVNPRILKDDLTISAADGDQTVAAFTEGYFVENQCGLVDADLQYFGGAVKTASNEFRLYVK
jgi:hypothetical protein